MQQLVDGKNYVTYVWLLQDRTNTEKLNGLLTKEGNIVIPFLQISGPGRISFVYT